MNKINTVIFNLLLVCTYGSSKKNSDENLLLESTDSQLIDSKRESSLFKISKIAKLDTYDDPQKTAQNAYHASQYDSNQISLSENSKQIITLKGKNLTYRAVVIKTSQSSDFVIGQIHSQYRKVTVSLATSYEYGKEETSLHAGIIARTRSNTMTYVNGNTAGSVNALLIAISYPTKYPIPGGCCLTCAMEYDPNIKVSYNSYKTHFSFSRASRWAEKNEQANCDWSETPITYSLRYSVYYFYVNENDLSEKNLFENIWKMSAPDRIKTYGKHLTDITGSDSLMFNTETIFAQGVIFNVIVSDTQNGETYETAYTPVATYGCNFTVSSSSPDSCTASKSKVSIAFSILFALFGLVICFGGFKLFRVTVFMYGSAFFWFIFYILLAKFGDHKVEQVDTLIMSFIISLCGGALVLFLYGFERFFYLVYLVVTLVLGMFVSAILFYTPFGYMDVWNVDYRFGLGFCSIAFIIAVISLFFPKAQIYFSTSLLGSYAAIMVPCYFLRANMQYIILTAVYRLTIKDFGSSFLRRPFEKLEYILTAIWAFLFIIGLLIQYRMNKDADFRFSGKQARHKVWDKLSQSVNLSRRRRRRTLWRGQLSSNQPLLDSNGESNSQPSQYNPTTSYGTMTDTQPQFHLNSTDNFSGSQNGTHDNLGMNISEENQPLIHQPPQTLNSFRPLPGLQQPSPQPPQRERSPPPQYTPRPQYSERYPKIV